MPRWIESTCGQCSYHTICSWKITRLDESNGISCLITRTCLGEINFPWRTYQYWSALPSSLCINNLLNTSKDHIKNWRFVTCTLFHTCVKLKLLSYSLMISLVSYHTPSIHLFVMRMNYRQWFQYVIPSLFDSITTDWLYNFLWSTAFT